MVEKHSSTPLVKWSDLDDKSYRFLAKWSPPNMGVYVFARTDEGKRIRSIYMKGLIDGAAYARRRAVKRFRSTPSVNKGDRK